MKKFMFFIVAVVMAVSFSAFTAPAATKKATTIDYQHNGSWFTYSGVPCPGDQVPECIKSTPHGNKQLYYDKNLSTPVYRNLP